MNFEFVPELDVLSDVVGVDCDDDDDDDEIVEVDGFKF